MSLTLDSPKLRKLTRTQLQSLAKREIVRAVGKTEDIIRRLVQKHPTGVPIHEDDDVPSISSAPPKRNLLRQVYEAPPPPSSRDRKDPKGKGKAVATASPTSSSSAQLLYPDEVEPVAGQSNAQTERVSRLHTQYPAPKVLGPTLSTTFPNNLPPVPPSGHPFDGSYGGDENARSAAPPEVPNHGWRAEDEDEAEVDGDYDYVKGAPTHYMVVDTLRQFTTLTNTIPTMKTRITESRCLLRRTEDLLKKAITDARELGVTREYLETFLLAKMKQKRELWDGTGKMEKKARKLRMEWLRAQRKVENEKKWTEANEFNKKHGLKLEPFSAFASESDEEVIESLLTTPARSRDGSSKRAREESTGADSDADSDADSSASESQRKRSRS